MPCVSLAYVPKFVHRKRAQAPSSDGIWAPASQLQWRNVLRRFLGVPMAETAKAPKDDAGCRTDQMISNDIK